jgi:hypothetical protein
VLSRNVSQSYPPTTHTSSPGSLSLHASHVRDAPQGFPVGGKRIKVSVARPQSDDIKNCKLYIANLPPVSCGPAHNTACAP